MFEPIPTLKPLMKYTTKVTLDLKKFKNPNHLAYWSTSYVDLSKKKTQLRKYLSVKKINNELMHKNVTLLNASNTFNLNNLRKEKMYTKLKYSRCPQYDTVSGGIAALLSAFLGFLISEKFGFELVDSGDFYILFMYVVFLVFSLRVFLKIISDDVKAYTIIGPNYCIKFYTLLLHLVIKFFTRYVIHYKTQINYKSSTFSNFIRDTQYFTTSYRIIKYWITFLKNWPKE